jgi:hypothetical protein
MIEVAWAAIKVKASYYRDKYYRLKTRRGPKKSILAIAHRLMKAIYHIIKHGARFHDLGEGFLTQKYAPVKLARLKKQAHQLGFDLVAQVA